MSSTSPDIGEPSVLASPLKTAPWRHCVNQPVGDAGVFFHGIVFGGTGYAEEGLVQALGLMQHDIPVQLVPVGPQEDHRRLLSSDVRESLEGLKRQKVALARSVLYQHAMAYLWRLDIYGRRRVGRTTFETDRLPSDWIGRCNAMDEVWVPTEFNRGTFTAAGVDSSKLHVVPEGVDTEIFRPGVRPLEIPHKRGFTFLSMFDLQARKGFDLLLKAYLAEFRADEDVSLVLKVTQHSGQRVDTAAELAYFVEREAGCKLEDTPPIILLDEFVPQSEMPRLYAAANAFVLPSHGEGFGRPYAEALACGLPVIATRWSGHLDFLHDENSFLIDIEGLVPACEEVEYFAGHQWAQPSVEHLRQLMRKCIQRPEEARRRAELGRAEMVAHWDWNVVIPRWIMNFAGCLHEPTTATDHENSGGAIAVANAEPRPDRPEVPPAIDRLPSSN